MKLYINKPKENWVVDRFIKEWNTLNYKTSNNFYFGKKVIWLISPWTWKKIPLYFLKKNSPFSEQAGHFMFSFLDLSKKIIISFLHN